VSGFTYVRTDGIIKVMSPAEALAEQKQTKVITLKNASASDLKESLKGLLSPQGSIEVDNRSNSLIITDTPRTIQIIEARTPSLDQITPQILIEAKMIETALSKEEKLGIDWTTTISASGSKRPTTLPFEPKGEAKWMKNIFPPVSSTDANFPTIYGFPYAVRGDFTFGTLDFSSLKMIFDFLKQRKNTKLIANPRIVTLNNQKATINVGKVLSLPTYERSETTGKMEIIGWQEKNVGVSLEVTPRVSPDGRIKLKIRPEVSSLIGYASTREGVNEGPITSTRSAETEVQIKDGQTVVIGGLIKDESLLTIKKIPILGDIPLLGFLFTRKVVGSNGSPTERTDLLIFVTARTIKETVEPLLAYETGLTTSPRPFKLEERKLK
jgi:type II secretory pathway component GspD/PulD (secretin)